MMRLGLAAVGLLSLVSCAPVPLATSYPLSFQQKMQAVEHWQLLAEGLSNDLTNQIRLRPDLVNRPIFVAQKHRAGFPEAFENYLTTALANRQFMAARNPSGAALVLDYGIQQIRHTPGRNRNPFPGIGTLAGTAAWLGHQGASHWSGGDWAIAAIPAGAALDLLSQIVPTNTEVIITVGLSANGQNIMRQSRNFYIPDGDAWQYPNIAVAFSGIPAVAGSCRLGELSEAPCRRIVMDP
jgi:hypothetical protein